MTRKENDKFAVENGENTRDFINIFNRYSKSESQREISCNAARDRRDQESDLFDDLKCVVPAVDELLTTRVDRIGLLRLGVAMCRLRKSTNTCK